MPDYTTGRIAMALAEEIVKHKALIVEQRHELAELIGIETRNQYGVTVEERLLILAAAAFIELQYFENKAD